METIKVTEEVYRKLISLKGNKSFSEIIEELLEKDSRKKVSKNPRNVLPSELKDYIEINNNSDRRSS